jgi:hypothetical protein
MSHNVSFYPYDPKQPLSKQYPELGRHEKIRDLKNHEQLFCWLYACKSSYLMESYRHDNRARATKAFEIAYLSEKYDSREHADFSMLLFPDHIKAACEVFATFDPDIRARGRDAAISSYEACLSIMNESMPTMVVDGDGEKVAVTPAHIKQIIEAKSKARTEMAELIPIIEEGFGTFTIEDDHADNDTIMQYIREKRQKRTR